MVKRARKAPLFPLRSRQPLSPCTSRQAEAPGPYNSGAPSFGSLDRLTPPSPPRASHDGGIVCPQARRVIEVARGQRRACSIGRSSPTAFLWAWQPRLLSSITFHKLCLWGVAKWHPTAKSRTRLRADSRPEGHDPSPPRRIHYHRLPLLARAQLTTRRRRVSGVSITTNEG